MLERPQMYFPTLETYRDHDPGRNQIYSACCSAQSPHKPVMKSKQWALRAYCPNIFTVSSGKNFHHVYNLAMSEPVTQTHEYREAFQYLKMSERIGLIETLTTFSHSLRKNGK